MWGTFVWVAMAAAAVALVCVSLASAEPIPQSDLFTVDSRSDGGVYCGNRLSEALKLLCGGQYNSYFKSKKTSPPEDEYWVPPVQLPFRDRLRAAAFLESRSRFTRGVTDECCKKSCTTDELMSYCEKRE